MHSDEARQRERVPVEVYPDADKASKVLAEEIAALIRDRQKAGRTTVLGLATGSTPVRLYRELIRRHREEGLSFRSVISFNLDEYYGLEPEHPESYAAFMREQLFAHVDINPENCHIPKGTVPRKNVHEYCRQFEEYIRAVGGIDVQVLGIGRTGHIGFNEPGSSAQSRTRLVTLDAMTRRDAARDFLGEQRVPRHAITMGVGTILEARKVVLLAWGENKAASVVKAVEEDPTAALPASFLQGHPDCRFLLDVNAAAELTRFKHPWKVSYVDWQPARIRQAVLWLAMELQKPILKLTDENYTENALADLITEKGPAYDLNINIFNQTQKTITGWPGGKPNADDSQRPERASPHPKRIVIFSPEPGNDVTGMGGTINRLVKQGHEVQVCYLTSGNLGVEDEDILKFLRFSMDFMRINADGDTPQADTAFARSIREEVENKSSFDLDSPTIRSVKGLVRKGEAKASLQACGLSEDCITFLDLPFYDQGRYRRFAPAVADLRLLSNYLESIKPHSVFITGRRADPVSLQAICFQLFTQAYRDLSAQTWTADCRVWIYPSETVSPDPHEIDMSVPLSPSELKLKIAAIYQHQSQRSQSPTLNSDRGEIWDRIGARNRAAAALYDQLGMAEYEAMEAFQLWDGES